MKILLALSVGMLSCSAIAAVVDPPRTVGRIASVAGTVTTSTEAPGSAQSVEMNWPVAAGDSIETGADSRTELSLSGAIFWLEEDSALAIIELEPGFARLRLDAGLVLVHVPDRQRRSAARLESMRSAVDVNMPGDYLLRVEKDGTAHVAIQAGDAKVHTTLLAFDQHAGEEARIAADGTVAVEAKGRRFIDQSIATRAQQERGRRSESHVARNLVGYEELDAYGAWHWEREFGMVWEPRTTNAKWMPFRFGHWIWKAPWGWTWVDDAPWGFATSHYGRWVKIHGRWSWMAGARQIDAVYAPAPVGWLSNPVSPELVGWFPLRPDQEYVPLYPASYAHRRGVNTLVSVARGPSLPRATSADISDSVTWMPRTAFGSHPLPSAHDTHVAADPGAVRR